jgi:hypothetical protein
LKATFDPSQRLILLVASRQKLEEMTVNAEIGISINNAIDSRWSPAGWAGKLALDYYRKNEIRSLKKLSDIELHDQFNRSMHLGFPVAWCSPIGAKQKFDFGVGHIPIDGTLYLQHPINTQSYISPNAFSRSICSEKEAAFLRLAASLGAKSIQLTSILTNDTKGVFSSKLKAPEVAADLGYRAKFDKSGDVIKEVVKEFNRPTFYKPYIPEQLAGWVNFDPDLRTMATDRIEANVAKSNVKLEFSQSLGLGGELSARIADRGISLGGKFNSVARSIWSFEVEYFDLGAA